MLIAWNLWTGLAVGYPLDSGTCCCLLWTSSPHHEVDILSSILLVRHWLYCDFAGKSPEHPHSVWLKPHFGWIWHVIFRPRTLQLSTTDDKNRLEAPCSAQQEPPDGARFALCSGCWVLRFQRGSLPKLRFRGWAIRGQGLKIFLLKQCMCMYVYIYIYK
jgi:hypothetical protein